MDLLESLISSFGISGSEEKVRSLIQNEIKKYVDEIKIDKFGNLIARKKGVAPKVMLAAHMDEVGLVTKNIDKEGKIGFSVIGGVEVVSLLGQIVAIQTDKGEVLGVITTDNISIGKTTETLPKLENLYIDTGLKKEELESKSVRTGNYVHFYGCGCINRGKIVCGKALDNRIGCYILIELAKRLKSNKNEIFYVFTVQEEIGLYGAKTSAYTLDPAWAIAVDITYADDATTSPTKILGKGPCITVKDASMIGNKCINSWLIEIAKKNDIPLQYDVSDLGVTDALSISISKGGIPTTTVSVPVRNVHTVVGMANKDDIINTIKLLELLLKNPPLACMV